MVEIVFMTFIILVVFDVNYAVTEMTIKYFLVQVMSGIFLLICVLLGFFGLGRYVHWLLWGGLAVKLGLVPFHFWAISVVGKIGWLSLFFILRFIKLLPIAFLVYLSESFWAGALLVPSALVGSFCGINNQFIQKLLRYSGIVSTCWLALAAAEGFTFFFFFFCWLRFYA